jgi:hypothetical protein
MPPTGVPPVPLTNLGNRKSNATSSKAAENVINRQSTRPISNELWANSEYANSLKVTFAQQLPEVGRADIAFDIIANEILKSEKDASSINFFAPVRGTSWIVSFSSDFNVESLGEAEDNYSDKHQVQYDYQTGKVYSTRDRYLYKIIRTFGTPFNISEEEVARHVVPEGIAEVMSQEYEHWQDEKKKHMKNGVCRIKIKFLRDQEVKVRSNIIGMRTILGADVRVTMAGDKQACFVCGSHTHIKSGCPKNYLSYSQENTYAGKVGAPFSAQNVASGQVKNANSEVTNRATNNTRDNTSVKTGEEQEKGLNDGAEPVHNEDVTPAKSSNDPSAKAVEEQEHRVENPGGVENVEMRSNSAEEDGVKTVSSSDSENESIEKQYENKEDENNGVTIESLKKELQTGGVGGNKRPASNSNSSTPEKQEPDKKDKRKNHEEKKAKSVDEREDEEAN